MDYDERLRCGRSPRRATSIGRIIPTVDPGEIPSERLYREFFGIDFLAGSDAAAAEKRHWRAPSLGSVLEKERQNQAWDHQKLPINQKSEEHSTEGKRRRICFEHAFHIPFAVETLEAAGECRIALAAGAENAPLRRPIDPFVKFARRVFANSVLTDHSKVRNARVGLMARERISSKRA